MGRGRENKKGRNKIKKNNFQKKKDPGVPKGRKSRNIMIFQ